MRNVLIKKQDKILNIDEYRTSKTYCYKCGKEKLTLNEALIKKYNKKKTDTKTKKFIITVDIKTLINLIYFFILINTLSRLCTSIGSI